MSKFWRVYNWCITVSLLTGRRSVESKIALLCSGSKAVCASNVKYSSFKRRTPTGESPRNAGVTTRSLVSRKVVYREVCTEVSETTSVCTDEQKLNRRHR